MPLLNTFKIGADPEFVLLNDGHLTVFRGRPETYSPWGLDHGGYVIEPHPKPDPSVRNVIQNLKTCMNDFATVAPTGKWRAGAFMQAPERTITMGGHVHVDQRTCSKEQRDAMDLFAQHLEALDILPATECNSRRATGTYGRLGDIRTEHGHFEYRSLPSWLYSQRVAKICLAGVKLLAVDPPAAVDTLGSKIRESSKTKLASLFERFRGRDDDADWILSSGMLTKKLEVKPDRDLRDVWKVKPEKETPHWKEQDAQERLVLAGQQAVVQFETHSYRFQHDNFVYRVRLHWRTVWNDITRGILRDFVIANNGMPEHLMCHWVRYAGLAFYPYAVEPVVRTNVNI